jgi:hypothetical protein
MSLVAFNVTWRIARYEHGEREREREGEREREREREKTTACGLAPEEPFG